MWWVGAALAATPVVVPIDSGRIVTTAVPVGWTEAKAPAGSRCWERPLDAETAQMVAATSATVLEPARACIAVLDAGGRDAKIVMTAEQSKVKTRDCQEARGGGIGAVTAMMQSCRILATGSFGYERIGTWHVTGDGVKAAVLTIITDTPTSQDVADIRTFTTTFQLRSPLAAGTRGLPVCGALQDALIATADGFAKHKGAPTGERFATTLPWPDAVETALVPGPSGLGFEAVLLRTPDAASALALTQATITNLGKCDTWCTPMASRQEGGASRTELILSPRDGTAPSAACGKVDVRVILATDPAGSSVTLRTEPGDL